MDAKGGVNGSGTLTGSASLSAAFQGAFKLAYNKTWSTQQTESTSYQVTVPSGDALMFGASAAMQRIAGSLLAGIGLAVRNVFVDGRPASTTAPSSPRPTPCPATPARGCGRAARTAPTTPQSRPIARSPPCGRGPSPDWSSCPGTARGLPVQGAGDTRGRSLVTTRSRQHPTATRPPSTERTTVSRTALRRPVVAALCLAWPPCPPAPPSPSTPPSTRPATAGPTESRTDQRRLQSARHARRRPQQRQCDRVVGGLDLGQQRFRDRQRRLALPEDASGHPDGKVA
ncbi:hypothetical protein GXW82_36360 [Streptacidiphilus sp. 4-A2]|nr:hypothetical protein [Streptacidiphilus sp. 4-A2]